MFQQQQQHWKALVIAVASSTDNLLVGVSLGMGVNHQFVYSVLVWGIGVANALGCWLATYSGNSISGVLRVDPNNLAGIAFLVLGCMELQPETANPKTYESTEQHKKDDDARNDARITTLSSTLSKMVQLAVPMTLNNLAGGVATGVAGIDPLLAAIYVLLASVLLMFIGIAVGRYLATMSTKRNRQFQKNTALASAVLYAILGIQCFLSVV